MHCKYCEYLLFNLTQPICPECGRSFDIEWYRFKPGEVSFNCPHCDQEYYGNDERGLPYPRQFTCVQCNQPVTLQQMRVVPKHPDAVGVFGDLSPWDRRRQTGLIKAWWQTFTMTLIRPGQFFRTHSGRSIKEAWLFAMITYYIAFASVFVYATVIFAGLGTLLTALGPAGGAAPPVFPFALMVLLYGCLAIVGPPILPFVFAGISTCTIHLALLFLAPKRKPMDYTLRTAMYAVGPYALCVIPFCGDQAGSIWTLVTLIFGVKEVHGISGWRSSIAVLWPVVALLGLYVLGIIVFVLNAAPVR